MSEASVGTPEFPNIISLFADILKDTPVSHFLRSWENVIFSLVVAVALTVMARFAARKCSLVPGKLQNAAEALAGGLDDFVCGILGARGRKYTPFIGTLFIYILAMNLFGLIPFMKSATSSWSITAALALCVFVYVQYTAFKELGFLGYLDHMAGKPRGAFAYSIVFPVMMFSLHLITELIKPMTLSLRLRSNVWGDDMLLAVMAGFGIPGLPLLFFSMLLTLISSVIQAIVFCMLTTVYFALVLPEQKVENR